MLALRRRVERIKRRMEGSLAWVWAFILGSGPRVLVRNPWDKLWVTIRALRLQAYDMRENTANGLWIKALGFAPSAPAEPGARRL